MRLLTLSLWTVLAFAHPAWTSVQNVGEVELKRFSQYDPVDIAVDTAAGRAYSLGWEPQVVVFDLLTKEPVASSNPLSEFGYAYPLSILSDGRGRLVALFYAWDNSKYRLAVCVLDAFSLQRLAIYWADDGWIWGATLDETGENLAWVDNNRVRIMNLNTGSWRSFGVKGLPGYTLYLTGAAFDASRQSLWVSAGAYRNSGSSYEVRRVLSEVSMNPPHPSVTYDIGSGWSWGICAAAPGKILLEGYPELSMIETGTGQVLWKYSNANGWLTRALPLLDGGSVLAVHSGWGSYTLTLLNMDTGQPLRQKSYEQRWWTWPLAAISHKQSWVIQAWGWGGDSFLDVALLEDLTLEKRINLSPIQPIGLALDEGLERGFISGSGGTFEIDLSQRKILRELNSTGLDGWEVDFDPVGKRLFVTHPWWNQISVLDTLQDRLVATLKPGGTPRDVAFNSEGNSLCASYNIYSCPLAIYKGSTLERTGTAVTGGWPAGVAISSSGFAYVADMWDGKVRKVQLADSQVVASYGAGSYPERLAVDEGRGLLAVTNRWNSPGLTLLDLATGLAGPTIPTGAYPLDVALWSKAGRAYVLNAYPPGLSVVGLSSRIVLETIPLPSAYGYYYGRLAVDETRGRIYVTDYYGSKVHVFQDSIDVDPPPAPLLGNEPAYTQGASNSLTWSRCEDNESGLKGYTLQVSRDENFSVDLTTTIFVSGIDGTVTGLGDGVRYFYRVRAEDFSGNKSGWSNGTSSIQDASPPETHISLQGLWGEGGWLVSPASVTFSARDTASGVSKIYYSLDGKIWKETPAGLLGLPQEGVETILYYSVDNVGNVEVSLSTTVRKDFSSPSSWATFPKEGGFYKEIASVNGAASDNLSGVAQVELSLYHCETAQYFTGSGWSPSESWWVAQGKDVWISPLPSLPEGRFILRPRARDVAGHVEISISSISFHVDRTPPLSRITSPLDNSFHTSHTPPVILSGTASDARSPLAKVEVSIKDETTLKFWNGTSWVNTESWVLAQGLENWSYTPPVESGHSYFVKSRAWDSSGNMESSYNPNGDSWKTLAPMSIARYGLAVGVINGKLYAVGGSNSGTLSNTLEVYDPAADTWAPKAPMPTAREALAAGTLEGNLYVVGGYGGGIHQLLEVYDPATNTWTKKASMPTARWSLATAVIDGKLYAVGGYANGYASALEVYDPATDTWTPKASMPTPRNWPAAATLEGKLYVVGGYNNGFLATLEVYDPATDTWTTKTPMPTRRSGLAAGVINGKLYAVGGNSFVFGSNYSTKLEIYDPATDTWTSKAPMPTPRTGLAAGVINGKLYAVGGSGSTNLEVYTPSQASGGVRYTYKTHCDTGTASNTQTSETTPLALTTQTTVTTQVVAVSPSGTSSVSGPASSATQEATAASSPSSVQMISLSVSTENVASGSILVCWEVSPSVAVYLVRLEIKRDTDPDTVFYLECEIPAFQSESFEEHSGYSFFYNSQKGVIELLDQRVFQEFSCGHEGKVTVTASIRAKTSSGLISSESSLSQEVKVGSAHAELVTPKAGKRLRGNAVTLVATASTGTARVVFQYKAASENNWHDIFSDGRAPFAAYWNLSSLSNGEYDIRSVAYDAQGQPDISAKAERVFLDDVNTDITEDGNPWVDPNAAHVKKERIISSKDSLVAVADGTQVFVPSGTLASNDFLVLEHISGKDLSSELGLGGGLSSAGALRRLHLSSGLRKFPKPVQITFPFSDENGDGTLDGTSLKVSDLKVFYLEEDSAGKPLRWIHVPSQVVGSSVRGSPVFLDGNQVVAQVDHFTIFGLFAQTPSFSPEISFILGEVYVFPNPSRGSQNPIFHIEVGEADEVEVFIYDVSGALVETLRTTASPQTIEGKLAYEMPWTPSTSGIYVAIIHARKAGEADIRLSRKFGVIK